MAETIQDLRMYAFRGIPKQLELSPRGNSLLIYGDNGTGKSTLADALEWYFTGQIDYLAREGRPEGVRHAGSPGDLETRVEIETDGDLGGVMSRRKDSPEGARAAGARETFLLRGRTLADFVDKTKGEKWKTLAEVLGIEKTDDLRADLRRAHRLLRDARRGQEDELNERKTAVREAGAGTTEAELLAAIEDACQEAGVAPPDSLEEALDPTWKQQRVPVDPAAERVAKLKVLEREIEELSRPEEPPEVELWNTFVDSDAVAVEPRVRLFDAARDLTAKSESLSVCPLCGQEVEEAQLQDRIETVVEELREAAVELDEHRDAILAVERRLEGAVEHRAHIRGRADELDVELPEIPEGVDEALRERVEVLDPVDTESIRELLQALEQWDDESGELLSESARKADDGRHESLVRLVRLLLEGRALQEQKHVVAKARHAEAIAERIAERFAASQKAEVDAVFARISKRVAEIYDRLHPGEGIGDVSIATWGHKGAELTVEFHGDEHRPPQRVLSESHMNSLGIALFLAMADTFNEQLGFVVLDDVVNSFDMAHRGPVADLLTDEYEDIQLIILTHDLQFFRKLQESQPQWKTMEFKGWTYNEGPDLGRYRTQPLLEQARAALADDDVIQAAQKGRRSLEQLLWAICEGFEAPLPFRRGAANEQRDATELLKGVRRDLKRKKRLGAGAKAFRKRLNPLFDEIQGELQGVFNVEVHEGRGQASGPEVEAALERIESLRNQFRCSSCETYLWRRGSPDSSSRCNCGRLTFPPPPLEGQ